MFCKQCGKQVPDGAKFCRYCGAPMAQAQPAAPETQQGGSEDIAQPVKKNPKKSRVWIPIVIIIAAALVAVLLIWRHFGSENGSVSSGSASRSEVDLNDYVEIDFNGYDGSGTARAHLDLDALSDDLDARGKISSEGKTWGYKAVSEVIGDNVSVSVSPSYELSNGEEVTVNWNVSEEEIDEMVRSRLNLAYGEENVAVSGLEELQTFDAFEGVTVEFSGTSPNAEAVLVVNNPVFEEEDYTIDRTSGLAKGDSVTVTVDSSAVSSIQSGRGMIPAETSKEYPVENVAYYVTSLEDIPEDGMEKMIRQTMDARDSISASNGDPDKSSLTYDYYGSYFLYEKPGLNKSDVNIIYIVLQMHLTQYGKNEDGSANNVTKDYYWYCGFTNGMILADGTFTIDYNNYTHLDHSSWSSSPKFDIVTYDYTQTSSSKQKISGSYTGYENVGAMFNNLVATKVDDYTYESTVPED